MDPRQKIKLSKIMSVALRHDPEAFGLTLDENGWVRLDDLLNGLQQRPRWNVLKDEHIRLVIKTSAKQRFELVGNQIRARYGHSTPVRPSYQAVEPPPMLPNP